MPRYERILPLIAILIMGLGLILLVPGVDALTLTVPLPELPPGPAWRQGVVDAVRLDGAASLALDDSGYPGVAYAGQSDGLRFAYFGGMSWVTSTVDGSGQVGPVVSLDVDRSELPRLAYVDTLSDSLKYARMERSSWWVTVVPVAGKVGPAVALALDGADLPHIAYCTAEGTLQYAYYNGLVWITSTVDSGAKVARDLSLAVDAADHPHVAYYDTAHQDLRYAAFDGDSWRVTTVDEVGDVGRGVSLALDRDGRPHLCYYDATHGHLKYARYDGTSWDIAAVGPSPAGASLGLALDSAGRPHLVYSDAATGGLAYANYNGEAWSTHTVFEGGEVARVWLALDAADRPTLLYYEPASGLLKYAAIAAQGGFEVQVSIAWLLLLFLLVAMAAGTEALLVEQGDEGMVAVPTSRPLRLHPASWIVPVLLTLTAFLFLRMLRGWPVRLVGLAVVAILLLVAFAAQHYTYAERPQVRNRARLVLDILVYVIAYFLFGAIYTLKIRSLFSATAIVVLAFLLALALLHRLAPRGQTRLYAAVVGFAVGQLTWPLNYWAIWGMVGGALLLGVFYVLISLVRYHLQGTLTRQVALEFILFGTLVVSGIGLYGFLIHPR